MAREEVRSAGGGETQPKGRRTSWAKRLGIAVLVAVVIGVAIFVVVGRMTAEPERVVRDFVAQAAAGNYAAAHDHFSAPLKQLQPLEAFSAAVQANTVFFEVTEMSFNQRSIDQAGAELAGSVTLEVGTVIPASFRLVREQGSWKLIGYHIGS